MFLELCWPIGLYVCIIHAFNVKVMYKLGVTIVQLISIHQYFCVEQAEQPLCVEEEEPRTAHCDGACTAYVSSRGEGRGQRGQAVRLSRVEASTLRNYCHL